MQRERSDSEKYLFVLLRALDAAIDRRAPCIVPHHYGRSQLPDNRMMYHVSAEKVTVYRNVLIRRYQFF